MGAIPRFMLRHVVTVEPYLGRGAHGPIYGPPVATPAFVDESRRLVRDATGEQAVSEARVFAPRETVCPTGSRVTLPSGRIAYALAVSVRDGGGLPTPDHLEIALT